MRNILRVVIPLIIALFFSITGIVHARESAVCTVDAGQTITRTLYSVCQFLTINGTVKGDVVALAGGVSVNGTVDGEIIAITPQIAITGQTGSLRLLAAQVDAAPTAHINGDLAAIGGIVRTGAPITGSAFFIGYQQLLAGSVGGDLRFYGSALDVQNVVGGSADITVVTPPVTNIASGFTLGDSAKINGDVQLSVPDAMEIPSDKVGGTVNMTPGQSSGIVGVASFADVSAAYFSRVLRDVLALMLVGVVALLTVQRALDESGRRLIINRGASMGYGLLAIVLSMPAAILLVILSGIIVAGLTLVTLGGLTPASSLVLLTLNLLLIGGFWLVVTFPARLVVCYVIGQWVGRRIMAPTDRATFLLISLLIGVILYAAITNLPFGILTLAINLIAAASGLGAILLAVRNAIRPSVLPFPNAADETAPLLLTESNKSVGMDNLPDGFTWFDER